MSPEYTELKEELRKLQESQDWASKMFYLICAFFGVTWLYLVW